MKKLNFFFLCCYSRDSMIVSCGNTVLSLVGGLVVFTYLGHLAGQLHLDIHKAVAPGKKWSHY